MTKLKKYSTISDWEAEKSNLVYPSVGLVGDGSVVYMTPPVHTLPIKAVFYDSATGGFVKMYPDEITDAIPTYTPIGVEVIPSEHDVYGTGQAGIMSLAEMNSSVPDIGSTVGSLYWGGRGINTLIPDYNKVNKVSGSTTMNGYLPSDLSTGATSLDGVSKYSTTSNNLASPYKDNGGRNEAYYATAYSTANALSDFDGVGNTKVLTDLATSQSNWKTATTITDDYNVGYYPAACCCWRFHTPGTNQGQWYLPACGEMGYVINRYLAINTTINKVVNVYPSVRGKALSNSSPYWTSSEFSDSSVRIIDKNGYVYYSSKTSIYDVRAFLRL